MQQSIVSTITKSDIGLVHDDVEAPVPHRVSAHDHRHLPKAQKVTKSNVFERKFARNKFFLMRLISVMRLVRMMTHNSIDVIDKMQMTCIDESDDYKRKSTVSRMHRQGH